MLAFICYPKCTTCQKAKKLLDSYHAQYDTRNIKADNPGYDELKNWFELSGLPIHKFFNTSGVLYKSLGLKDKLPSMSEDECLKLLATDGMLVKRPLLVDEYRALVGFNATEWEVVFTEYDRKGLDNVFQGFFAEMLERIKAVEENEDIPKKTRVVNNGSSNVVVHDYDVPIIINGQSAFNFATTVEQAYGSRHIVISKGMIAEDFFDLTTGIANEIAQKLVDSGAKLVVIGDFTDYLPFYEFISQSGKDKHLFFAADEDEALKKLREVEYE